jgi:hypothetical protein
MDTGEELELREQIIKDTLTLLRNLLDHGQAITPERLRELWAEDSDAEIAGVVDKLAHVVDWLGLF